MPQPSPITVVGSLNIDLTFAVGQLPQPGETIIAKSVSKSFGGKGANQAIAAARAGAQVSLIGAMGSDEDANRYRERLQKERIDTTGIDTCESHSTGSAFILVDAQGENTITVNPGANAQLTPELLDTRSNAIRQSQALLLQLETPLSTIARATQIARNSQTTAILNPSPWNDALDLSQIPADIIIVNQSEALALTQAKALDPAQLQQWVDTSQHRTALVITRGSSPTLLIEAGKSIASFPPPKVQPVDTVGAGDCFAGSFAAAIASGKSLPQAIRRGNEAGARATQSRGAQAPNIPDNSSFQ